MIYLICIEQFMKTVLNSTELKTIYYYNRIIKTRKRNAEGITVRFVHEGNNICQTRTCLSDYCNTVECNITTQLHIAKNVGAQPPDCTCLKSDKHLLHFSLHSTPARQGHKLLQPCCKVNK